MKYEEMLRRARKAIPKEVFERPRFEIPRGDSFIQGNRTIIVNFKPIASYLNRDPNHLLKYLLGELATFGTLDGARAIFTGRFGSQAINQKIEKYINEFVTCSECKKPDTRLIREDRITFMKCMACGAKKPVRSLR
jgi:translation initiation factor 2 subunit 2